LGGWEIERLRDWEIERLRGWEIERLGDWEVEKFVSSSAVSGRSRGRCDGFFVSKAAEPSAEPPCRLSVPFNNLGIILYPESKNLTIY
jgi:hypothetical protein